MTASNRFRSCLRLLPAVSALVMAFCAGGDLAGGNSSETTNPRITASVRYPDGTVAAGAAVRIRSSDYEPSIWPEISPAKKPASLIDTVTDADGVLQIDVIDTGAYFIEINDGKGSAVLLACVVDDSSTVDFGDTLLDSVGGISGSIDTAEFGDGPIFAMIQGLERLVPVNQSTGSYGITDVPAGAYTVVLVSADTAFTRREIDGVSVTAGGSVTVPESSYWSFTKRLVINTTAAGIAEDVHEFPLLVRLDASAIDFSQARPDGADIRFVTPGGKQLPYEIEQWDRAAKEAAVWVRVDTVRANLDNQYLYLWYGNPNAPARSDGAAVFRPDDGSIGVWHLGTGAGRRNSASASYPARPGNYDGDEQAPGVIGWCDSLEQDDHDTLGVINLTLATVSAWVCLSQTQDWARIVQQAWPAGGQPYHAYGLVTDSGAASNTVCAYAIVDSLPVQACGRQPLPFETWTHLCMIYDGAKLVMYVDGAMQSEMAATGMIDQVNATTYIAWQPGYPGNQKFIGKIDEVRIGDRARSAAYVRLSFENQKIGQTVVRVE